MKRALDGAGAGASSTTAGDVKAAGTASTIADSADQVAEQIAAETKAA